MNKSLPLSDEQQKCIEATLVRIRGGMNKHPELPTEEPSHVYNPEVANDDKK